MEELREVKKAAKPSQVFMVVDSMMGQDAVNTALEFEKKAGFDGIILTKMDGDSRGGAALSIVKTTGKPIKFTGYGEKAETLDVFYPDRLASRILGMGDMLGLIERAGRMADEKKAKELEEKIRKEKLDLSDFLEQLKEMKKLGPVKEILKMLPAGFGGGAAEAPVSDEQLKHIEAIIYSMTLEERRNPNIINGKRKIRIAKGSGTSVQEINQLLKKFQEAKKMMKKLTARFVNS
jgi:signal recognition particle subunit SRP54